MSEMSFDERVETDRNQLIAKDKKEDGEEEKEEDGGGLDKDV